MVQTRSGAVVEPNATPQATLSKRRRTTKKKADKPTWYLALGDAIATATFVLLSSVFSEVAEVASQQLNIPVLAANLGVIVVGVLLHSPVCTLLNGALYNPSHNLAFYVAGNGPAAQHLWRVVGQITGGIVGATAAFVLIPEDWQKGFATLGLGVRPGIPMMAGFACELVLACILNVIVLWSLTVRNPYVSYWTLIAATLVLVVTGAELSGPSMNPAISFGWYFHLQGHAVVEHVLVYWAAPLLGALLAGWVWTLIKPTKPSTKRKLH